MINYNHKILCYSDLGFIDYKEAWDLQQEIHKKRVLDEVEDFLNENKISVYDIDRGGDITYHGPGQIVGYPIIDLNNWFNDTHKYLRALEEVIIKTCSYYGLEAGRNQKHTGVWLGDKKIAAIGIKVSRWVTMHGFAFNVNTNLGLFDGIIPCGIKDKSVTSLKEELKREIDIQEVKKRLQDNFKEVFGYASVDIKHKNEILKSNFINI